MNAARDVTRSLAAAAVCLVVLGCTTGGRSSVVTPAPALGSPGGAGGSTDPYRVGDAVDVREAFAPAVRITVVEVQQADHYGEYSKPATGNVYLAVRYQYESLEDGATYNPFDWQVFVANTAVQSFTFVLDGPEPQLGSGTLPKGRKAVGWVVYEVPVAGRVLLSYGGVFTSKGPLFDVVAREK